MEKSIQLHSLLSGCFIVTVNTISGSSTTHRTKKERAQFTRIIACVLNFRQLNHPDKSNFKHCLNQTVQVLKIKHSIKNITMLGLNAEKHNCNTANKKFPQAEITVFSPVYIFDSLPHAQLYLHHSFLQP